MIGGEDRIALAASLVGGNATVTKANNRNPNNPNQNIGNNTKVNDTMPITDAASLAVGELNLNAWNPLHGDTPSSILTDSTVPSYMSLGQHRHSGTDTGMPSGILLKAPDTGGSVLSIVTPDSAFAGMDDKENRNARGQTGSSGVTSFPDLTHEGIGEAML